MKKCFYLFFICLTVYTLSSCSLNNVKIDDDLQPYFEQNNLKGTFAVLDNTHEIFNIYNLHQYRDSAYAPGATFEILSTLIAVETGRVNDQNALIHIPGDTLPPVSLSDAFRMGYHPAFAQVAAEIGKDTMQFWLDSLHYGKGRILTNDEPFWQNDSLKLTPDEQLGFIAKVYFVSLPFQKRTQEIVRKMLVKEDNTLYTLAFKKSWQTDTKGRHIGWITGWIEENKHIYFFVLNAQPLNGQPAEGSLEKTMKAIMTHYGFFKGEK